MVRKAQPAPVEEEPSPEPFTVRVDGQPFTVLLRGDHVIVDGVQHAYEVIPGDAPAPSAPGAAEGHPVRSPLPGAVVRVAVVPGKPVKAGDTLFVVEAMKMENEVKAPVSGVVHDLAVRVGDPVTAGQIVAWVR